MSNRTSIPDATNNDRGETRRQVISICDFDGKGFFLVDEEEIQGKSMMFDQITSDPAILGGKPIIRGTRISVELILEWIASGATRESIIQSHPHLTRIDIEQALSYAAAAMRNEVLLTTQVVG